MKKIAYICDGLVPACSGKLGCFKCPGAAFDDNNTCRHTFNSAHAVYGTCTDPESFVPNRFVRFTDHSGNNSYYEIGKEEKY